MKYAVMDAWFLVDMPVQVSTSSNPKKLKGVTNQNHKSIQLKGIENNP